MEKLAKAGAAPFGWRMELHDMHQLSQALTLHSLSHCCSFSPLCVSPLSKGTDQKTVPRSQRAARETGLPVLELL